MGKESHFTSKRPRVFVRGIEGHYNLKEELARLRSVPRVVKGRELRFRDLQISLLSPACGSPMAFSAAICCTISMSSSAHAMVFTCQLRNT